MTRWSVYQGTSEPHDGIDQLPPPPPWRVFEGGPVLDPPPPSDGDGHLSRRLGDLVRARAYRGHPDEVDVINSALLLRRPLLVTGKPGTGKSTLAYAIAHELRLGRVLRWSITSRSTLLDGLYRYDAIRRVEDASLEQTQPSIGRYLRLGPLGTALLPYRKPRVLLIDELDKSDIDLPNDLLTLFEEGEFEIPELSRIADSQPEIGVPTADGTERVTIRHGQVNCHAFPVIIMTSNGEREFPPAFLRRCLQLELGAPDSERLASIVHAHLGQDAASASADLIQRFIEHAQRGDLATDQLLNAIYLSMNVGVDQRSDRDRLTGLVLHHLSSIQP
jgi:MoxR-like ATPase